MNSITRDRSTFVVQNSTEESVNVKYNRQNNSIRIFSAEQRLFFLDDVGLLQNKILLNTEYGVTIGEVYPTKNHHKGVAHIGDKKYSYTIENNMLEVFDKKRQPLLNFNLADSDALDNYEAAGILFAVVWLHSELSAATARKASAPYVS
ncbi:MAG TPA: hypothetical protein VFZ47_13360 [Chitinophagaceae bacterium]